MFLVAIMKFSNVYSLRLNFRSILRRSEPLQMQARGYARQSFNGGQQRLKSHMTVKAIGKTTHYFRDVSQNLLQ